MTAANIVIVTSTQILKNNSKKKKTIKGKNINDKIRKKLF